MDALIALFIAVLILVASTSLTVAALAGAEGSRQQSLATNAARQVLENLRTYKGARIPNGTYADATVFGSVPQLAEMTNSSASVTLTTFRGNVQQAKVTVQWRAGNTRRVRDLSVTTLITPQGVTP